MTTATDNSAQAVLYNWLDRYGLGSLADWAWSAFKAGKTFEEIQLDIYERPEFNALYPAYNELAKRGEAVSLDQYRGYVIDVKNYLHEYAIPSGMYDTPEAIGELMLKNVSRKEIQDRLAIAADAAFRAPKEVTDALKQRWGLGDGDLVGFWLDPDKALPAIQQQYQSAQIQGAATEAGMATSYEQYDRLASQGVDYATARRGFNEANRMSDLTNTEFGQPGRVSREDLVGGIFGSAAEARRTEAEAARRAAQFAASEGGAAAAASGVSGLGSARS